MPSVGRVSDKLIQARNRIVINARKDGKAAVNAVDPFPAGVYVEISNF